MNKKLKSAMPFDKEHINPGSVHTVVVRADADFVPNRLIISGKTAGKFVIEKVFTPRQTIFGIEASGLPGELFAPDVAKEFKARIVLKGELVSIRFRNDSDERDLRFSAMLLGIFKDSAEFMEINND